MISRARIDINAMRLSVLQAAKAMDVLGNKEARVYVSAVKAMVPEKVCLIIDQAMQSFGAMGMAREMPFAIMGQRLRLARIYEGPTEVHRMVIARRVLKGQA